MGWNVVLGEVILKLNLGIETSFSTTDESGVHLLSHFKQCYILGPQ